MITGPLTYWDKNGNLIEHPYIEIWLDKHCGPDAVFNKEKFDKYIENMTKLIKNTEDLLKEIEENDMKKTAEDIIKELNRLDNQSSTIDKIRHDYDEIKVNIVLRHLKEKEK